MAAIPVIDAEAVLTFAYEWGPSEEAVALQTLLGITADGWYGGGTQAAHIAELEARGLPVDTAPATTTTAPPSVAPSDVSGQTQDAVDDASGQIPFDPPPEVVTTPLGTTNQVCDENFTSGDDGFRYCWQESQTTAGTEYSAVPIEPLEITFQGEQLLVSDLSHANRLYIDYAIILTDVGGASWSQDTAFALYETMQQIPQLVYAGHARPEESSWVLTDDYIDGDIQVTDNGDSKTVELSTHVFENAIPRIALVEGKRGFYFSRRLHHALVRYVTEDGYDQNAVNKILTENYGVSLVVGNYPELMVTGESADRYQEFHPWELVEIINMFEEMPQGMHKVPGLDYLVRRLDGTQHPILGTFTAVAWVDAGYIEFSSLAFVQESLEFSQRLVIHEKAHFLWANLFDDQLKSDWIDLAGWYEDPTKESGWATTKTTEFVSAYAHLKNPDEDLAETISFFIINPDHLRSRAATKYEFVRDRIMQGTIYLSQLREDLTFEVYNLYPDYVYPGKIKRLNVSVINDPSGEKHVTIEIELHALDLLLEGAEWARTRVTSPSGSWFDIYLYPIGGSRSGTVLRATHILPIDAHEGFWQTQQFVLRDLVGNERYLSQNDFGWRLYVSNPDEDLIAPMYVDGSMVLVVEERVVQGVTMDVLTAQWSFVEANAVDQCYAVVNDETPTTYAREEQINGWENINNSENICSLEFYYPDYRSSGIQRLNYMIMKDRAGNTSHYYFTVPQDLLTRYDVGSCCIEGEDSPSGSTKLGAAPQVSVETDNPDVEPPELDLNMIFIAAEPTNPTAPNGETMVNLSFRVRDNISGYVLGNFSFRDPQGVDHQYYHYPERRFDLLPAGADLDWIDHTRVILLPAGSAPGTWGVSEITLEDRAGNFRHYDFTETITITFETESD